MFIRKKKNSSGSISVQIISKNSGKYKVIETIGCSKNEFELEQLLQLANERLLELEPNLFDFVEFQNKKQKLSNKDMRIIGDELIFGKLFEDIGCSKIILSKNKDKEIFKALIISRLLYPGSKLYLIDYYHIYKKQKIEKNRIYRFLDLIYEDTLKLQIEKCIFNHTKKIMKGKILLTFYDVTTLYFESESEDDLRRIGFSKEGKIARPQIQLGLFTTLEGYPLSFEVYEGNKYEGHTLIDILKKFQYKFKLKYKPIVVADRGMLNNANIGYLEENNYKYILAAKTKSISSDLKEQITNLNFIQDGTIHEISINKTIKYKEKIDEDKTVLKSIDVKQRLVLSYSLKRAKKDKYNRDKALERLEKKIKSSNSITKKDLKLSYYAKYLDLNDKDSNITFNINQNKIIEDSKLDGIKGFITNNFELKPNEIIEHYNNQYDVERAFRISKTDLKIRPIYHRLETRIKAHILISFVSYAVYKEFERKIKLSELDIKFKLIFDYIKTMYGYKTQFGIEPLQMDEIQQQIYDAIYKK